MSLHLVASHGGGKSLLNSVLVTSFKELDAKATEYKFLTRVMQGGGNAVTIPYSPEQIVEGLNTGKWPEPTAKPKPKPEPQAKETEAKPKPKPPTAPKPSTKPAASKPATKGKDK